MGNAASQQTLAGWDVEDVANLFEDDEEIGWFAPIVVENEIDGEKLLTMSEARLSELGKKPDGGSVDSTWLRSAVTFRVISALRDDLSVDGKGDNDSQATGESADTAAKAAKAAADAQAVAEMAAAVMAGDGERDAPSAAHPKAEKPPLPGKLMVASGSLTFEPDSADAASTRAAHGPRQLNDLYGKQVQ